MTTSALTPEFTATTAHTTTMTEDEATANNTAWSLFPTTSKYHINQEGLTKRKRWLVVDFDGTCTEKDTTPLLPYLAAYAAARQRLAAAAATAKIGMDTIDTIHQQNKHDLEHRLDLFQSLENEFVIRYNAVMESLSLLHPPPPSCSTTNDDEEREGMQVDDQQYEQTIYEILHVLDEPSTIVTGMVSESNVLDGLGNLSVNEIEQMIQLYDGLNLLSEKTTAPEQQQLGGLNSNSELPKVTIRLREGCLETLTRIILTTKYQNSRNSNYNEHDSPSACLGWSIAVLSINWCPALIDTALVQPVIMKTRQQQESTRTSTTVTGDESSCSKIEIPIWSNEVDGKGVISLNIPGSVAKRDCIIELRRQLVQQQQQQQTTATDDDNDSSPNIIIYIGDSPTDITALLEADIGIIIGNSNTTENIISLYSYIELVPIQQLTNLDDRGTNNHRSNKKHILWQAECWKEINDALTST